MTVVLQLGMGRFDEQRGGLNRYFEGLHSALADVGVDVTSIVVAAADDPRGIHAAAPADAPLVRRIVAVHRAATRLGRRCDVVDAHFALYAFTPVLLSPLRRRPLVVHFQGPWSDESAIEGAGAVSRWAKATIERAIYRRADAIVTLSTAFADLVAERYGVDSRRVHVLAPGIDTDAFAPGDRSAARAESGLDVAGFVALAVRRLVPRMGLEVLVDAWSWVVAERPDALLWVAGDGPLRHDLEARAERLGIAHNVALLGDVSERRLRTLYRAADLTVVPSIALEGFGLVTLESLASGTPVIGSDVGGLPEVLARLDPSLVVPAGDVGALGQRLLLAASDDLGLPDSATCRAHAVRAGWPAVAAEHLALYRQVGVDPGVRPVRAVFVDHVARCSGGELAMARLLAGFGDVEASVVLAEPGPLVPLLERQGVVVDVVPLAKGAREIRRDALASFGAIGPALAAVRYVLRLRRHLRSLHPDVVHTNSLKADIVGGVAARLAGIPVVWHVRDHIAPSYLPRSVAIVFRVAARFVPTAIIANSRSTLATLGHPSRRQPRVVVPSPLDPAFHPGPRRSPLEHPLRVAMVARLAPWKGQREFVRAFEAAFPQGDEEALLVGSALFGEDDYDAEIRALVAASPASNRIQVLGHRDDVADLLRDVDVLVHSSTIPEPFGQVVAEGMASGLAVVASDAGGPAELIRSGENGLLVPPGDVAALAAALRSLSSDPDLRRRLGDAATGVRATLDAAVVAGEVEGLYRRVLGRRRHRRPARVT